ncbi:MAG: isopentenyl phosphate kinase [Promethearchaeota archaeon]
MKNELIILKLGGSLLTDKNKPFSIRKKILEQCVDEIIKTKKKLIIVHGGGSFGHPIAKKYDISHGLNNNIENQILGLAKTHEAMIKFNLIIIKHFLKRNYPVMAIEPFSIFIKDLNGIKIETLESIEFSLEMGILPILYGDIIIDRERYFSILSGDLIILELCKNLQKFQVSKVIFAIEKDGVFIEKDGNVKFLNEISSNKIDTIKLASLDKKIDVTGGIESKLKIIKLIGTLNIPVQILNGLKKNFIYKGIMNQEIKSTIVSIPKNNNNSSDK